MIKGKATHKSGANYEIELEGISLRDYFAGQAIAGIATTKQLSYNALVLLICNAYTIADIMIEQGEEK